MTGFEFFELSDALVLFPHVRTAIQFCADKINRISRHTANELPQPQVDLALGLLTTNREPCKSSR